MSLQVIVKVVLQEYNLLDTVRLDTKIHSMNTQPIRGHCGLCGIHVATPQQLSMHLATSHINTVGIACGSCNQPKVVTVQADLTCWNCMPGSAAISNPGYGATEPAYLALLGNNQTGHDPSTQYEIPTNRAIGSQAASQARSCLPPGPAIMASANNNEEMHVYEAMDEIQTPRYRSSLVQTNSSGPNAPFEAWNHHMPLPVPTTGSIGEPREATLSSLPLPTPQRGGREDSFLQKGLRRVLPTVLCPLCGEGMLMLNFSSHLQKNHSNYKVVCPICEVTYVRPEHYMAHMKTIHYAVYEENRGYCHNVLKMVDYRRLIDRAVEGRLPYLNSGRSAPEMALTYMRGGQRQT